MLLLPTFLDSQIMQLAERTADIQWGFGGFGTGLSDLVVYIRKRHPRPDHITTEIVEEALKRLHTCGQIYLQNWNGNGYSPWRPDWDGFFRAFRLLSAKP
jgi:hypothetical protein